jgi:2-oxo-4-hydroxy-4-carboxy--5-ureidoimidazoline (OHCU) decarboxylase
MRERVENTMEAEIAEAIGQIGLIGRLRLEDAVAA